MRDADLAQRSAPDEPETPFRDRHPMLGSAVLGPGESEQHLLEGVTGGSLPHLVGIAFELESHGLSPGLLADRDEDRARGLVLLGIGPGHSGRGGADFGPDQVPYTTLHCHRGVTTDDWSPGDVEKSIFHRGVVGHDPTEKPVAAPRNPHDSGREQAARAGLRGCDAADELRCPGGGVTRGGRRLHERQGYPMSESSQTKP